VTEPLGWPRWLAKKAARAVCMLAPGGVAPGTRVLMYHRFRTCPRDPFSVTPAAFEAQVAWLAQTGRALSLPDFAAGIRGERGLPSDGVLVTIDDGYRDAYTTALPILRRHGVPGVLFVTVGAIEERGATARVPDDAHVSWDELGALQAASHGWDHRSLGSVAAAELADQLGRSRAALRGRLGIDVEAFAYPYGTRADYSAATGAAVAQAGYALAFTAQHGAVMRGCLPLEVPRIKVEGGEGLWWFRRLVAGGLDRWGAIDRSLWRLQASGGAA
jgi:peptidoglycan/xylan/chitin deacetylase (PgdA/CDA1 family)